MVPILPMPLPPSPAMWEDCARKQASPRRTVLEKHRLHPGPQLPSTLSQCGVGKQEREEAGKALRQEQAKEAWGWYSTARAGEKGRAAKAGWRRLFC